ncbi:hypothetical protein OKW27_001294 [Paraburkholderia sp. 35.1]
MLHAHSCGHFLSRLFPAKRASCRRSPILRNRHPNEWRASEIRPRTVEYSSPNADHSAGWILRRQCYGLPTVAVSSSRATASGIANSHFRPFAATWSIRTARTVLSTSSATHPEERVLLAGEIRHRTQDRHCRDSFRFPDASSPDRPLPFMQAMYRRFERTSVNCLPYFRTNVVTVRWLFPLPVQRPQAALPCMVFNSNGGRYGFRKVQRRQPNKPNVFLLL